MAEQLYTAKELAAILKVDPQTVYRLADKGEIESYKIGKSRRFVMPIGKDETNGKETEDRRKS